MKRDFLEALGLNKDVIDAIMAENGKSIEALRLRCQSLEEITAQRDVAFQENTALKEELQKTADTFTAFRDGVIHRLVSEARPSSALAEKELIRLMTEAANEGRDLCQTMEALKESTPDGFQTEHCNAPIFSAVSGGIEHEEMSLPIYYGKKPRAL